MRYNAHPTAGWDPLGDRFYERRSLYEFELSLGSEWDNYIVTGCKNGGALALYQDASKPRRVAPSKTRRGVSVYSHSGVEIRTLPIEDHTIAGIGWSDREELIVVGRNGSVRCFDIHGNLYEFSIGLQGSSNNVKQCKFWDAGFVALLDDNDLVSVENYDNPRIQNLTRPDLSQEASIYGWTVLNPRLSLGRTVEVFLAVGPGIQIADGMSVQSLEISNGPFLHMSISPNGKLVGTLSQEGHACVYTADFGREICRILIDHSAQVSQLEWCGNDSVVLARGKQAIMIGPTGDYLTHTYRSNIQLISEFDCVRVVCEMQSELVRKVPISLQDALEIGSSAPSAMLLDCIDQSHGRSPQADENIRYLGNDLVDAITGCIKAASCEMSDVWQSKLLRAASFGKAFLEFYSSDEFVETCEILRVLNQVRAREIGLALTFEQYVRLTPENLLKRLMARGQYFMSIKIANYLKLPVGTIHEQWSIAKLRASSDSDALTYEKIRTNCGEIRGIAYDEMSLAAFKEGRVTLATKLLDHERRAGRQVPLLLDMKQNEIAVQKAIESCDPNLIAMVVLRLLKTMTSNEVFKMIDHYPEAKHSFVAYARRANTKLLRSFYYQDDRSDEIGYLQLADAIKEPSEDKKHLRGAADNFKDNKSTSFEFGATNEELRLQHLQDNFNTEFGQSFHGLSVVNTIHKLVELGKHDRATKLKNDFKVDDTLYWWVRLRALVSTREWGELQQWASKNRKSPIGFAPFVMECVHAGNKKVAASFIPKCTDMTSDERVELWLLCSEVPKAIDEAYRNRDIKTLEMIRSKSSSVHHAMVDRSINALQKR